MSLEKQAEALSEALGNLLGLITRGGPGSGHHGHRGRPGEVGGSEPGKGPPRGKPAAGVAQEPGAYVAEELPYGLTPGALEMLDAHPDYERSASMLKNSMLVRYMLNKKAIEEFGECWRPTGAGYLLSNGRLVDFSGANEGGTPGYRAYDHRDIDRILPDDVTGEGYSEGMIWFMNMSGAIRWSMYNGDLSFDTSRPMTYKQISLIKEILDSIETVNVDISDETGNVIWSAEYDAPGRREINNIARETKNLLKKRSLVSIVIRGGPGSGHKGHAGRPGQVGGSLPDRVAKLEREMGIQRIPAPENEKPITLHLWRGETKSTPVDEGMYGKGTYFTPHRHYAEGFADATKEGRLIEADVSLEKPFVATYWQVKDLGRDAMRAVLDEGGNAREANEAAAKEIREFLEAQGYDGIVIVTDKNFTVRPNTVNEVLVFFPEDAVVERGGPGSGHHGHRGRLREVGGSEPGKGPPRSKPVRRPRAPAAALAQAPEATVPGAGTSLPTGAGFLKQLPLIKDRPVDVTAEGVWRRGKGFIKKHAGLYDPEVGWYFRGVDHDKLGDPVWAIMPNGEIRVGKVGTHTHGDLTGGTQEAIRGFMVWVGDEAVLLYYKTGEERVETLYKKYERLLNKIGYESEHSPTIMVSDDGGWTMRFPTSEDSEGFPPVDIYRGMTMRAGPGAAYFNVILDGDLSEKQGQILGQFQGLEAVPPDRLHITLLYIEDVERNLLEAMAAGLSEPLAFNVEAVGLEILGKDSDWLTLRINPSPGLIRLYNEVLTLASINGLPISDYSQPDEYKPHISLAQGDLSGIVLPDIEPFKVGVVGVQASVDDYEVVHISPLEKRGGPGSGHHGHVGRPGEIGGSQPKGAVVVPDAPPTEPAPMAEVAQVADVKVEPGDLAPIRLPEDMEIAEAWKYMREIEGFKMFGRDKETGEWVIIRDMDQAIDEFADEIRIKHIEIFGLFDESGQPIRSLGTETRVPLYAEDCHQMAQINANNVYPDRVVGVHNHPPNWGGQSFPPSFTDFKTMIQYGQTEMHVITPDGRWKVSCEGREIDPSNLLPMGTFWNKYADDHLYEYFPNLTRTDVGTPEWDHMLRTDRIAAYKYRKFSEERMIALRDKFSDIMEIEWIPQDDQK